MKGTIRTTLATLTLIGIAFASIADAATISQANLSGYIQNLQISNDAASQGNITKIVYSLGEAGNGIATWDTQSAGGTPSDFLSDTRYFQTVTWDGLAITPGNSASFGSLDIDLIVSMTPLTVTGSVLDNSGSSLINASVNVFWDNGDIGAAQLNQMAWRDPQALTISGLSGSEVPEIAPGRLLVGLGIMLLSFAARPKRALQSA